MVWAEIVDLEMSNEPFTTASCAYVQYERSRDRRGMDVLNIISARTYIRLAGLQGGRVA